MFIFFTFIFNCFAGSYNFPDLLTIPENCTVLTVQTELSKGITPSTNCKNINPQNIYTSVFKFSSTQHQGVVISLNSSIEMFIENTRDNSCSIQLSNSAFKIDTNVDYKLIFYSRNYSSEQINFTISYIQETRQNTNVTTYPFVSYVTVPYQTEHYETKCSNENNNHIIYGYKFDLTSEKDRKIEINTCSYSESLVALHIVDSEKEKCLAFSDTYSTADLQCADGHGAKVRVEIQSSMKLELYAGFMKQSTNERSFILNITETTENETESLPELYRILIICCIVIIWAFVLIICILILILSIVICKKKQKKGIKLVDSTSSSSSDDENTYLSQRSFTSFEVSENKNKK